MDHVRPQSTVDRGSAAESVVRACRSMVHRRYGSLSVAMSGGGGRGGRGGAGGALTGDGAAVKRPGDGGKAAVMKMHGGDEHRHEGGGKEGGVGCDEMRRGRGAFYRFRGGGRRSGNGEFKAAPLRAVCTGYRKRGRWRWPIKEG
jgi:hypothetical protein